MKKTSRLKYSSTMVNALDEGIDYFNLNITNKLINKYKHRKLILTLDDKEKNSSKKGLPESYA